MFYDPKRLFPVYLLIVFEFDEVAKDGSSAGYAFWPPTDITHLLIKERRNYLSHKDINAHLIMMDFTSITNVKDHRYGKYYITTLSCNILIPYLLILSDFMYVLCFCDLWVCLR